AACATRSRLTELPCSGRTAHGCHSLSLHDALPISQQRYQWRMSTTWTPALDVLQGAAQKMAKMVDDMSGGRLKIQVFDHLGHLLDRKSTRLNSSHGSTSYDVFCLIKVTREPTVPHS